MGDRYSWNENCIQCMGKNTVECYDAPTCLQWYRECNECGWKDDRDYYEAPNNIIELITEKEAREKGLIMDCPNKCGYDMTWWDKENYNQCIMCHQKVFLEKEL